MENREIKFRIWYKNQMRHNAIVGNGQVLFIPNATGEYKQINLAECIAMQFTGLHDKNGKEIYEGDILHCGWFMPHNYEVSFVEGGFCLVDLITKEWMLDINQIQDSNGIHFAIVGNIYEKHELLQEGGNNG